jgi:hypothetical protein
VAAGRPSRGRLLGRRAVLVMGAAGSTMIRLPAEGARARSHQQDGAAQMQRLMDTVLGAGGASEADDLCQVLAKADGCCRGC